MDMNSRLADFDLDVNPYDFLGVKRGCTDLKQITKAYHKKSLSLHPDKRKGHEYDFSTLNKCYVYLKTLIQELHGTGAAYTENLEERMRELQKIRLETEQNYERERKSAGSGYSCNGYGVANGANGANGVTGTTGGGGKIDFTQQLRTDNCIIGADQFDTNAAYEEMMRHRPTSTRYQELDVPSMGHPFPNRKFNRDQFNQHFMEKMQQDRANHVGMDPFSNVDGFTGFDELCGAASIVSDGQFMFVQGHVPSSMGSHATSTSAFGFLEQFSEYDRELERQRYAGAAVDGKVSDADVLQFSRMLDSHGPAGHGPNSNGSRLSKGQFNERMSQMEMQHQESLQQQQRLNKDVVDEQIARLTDNTRANLFSNLRITGNSGRAPTSLDEKMPKSTLSKEQEKRFAFPK